MYKKIKLLYSERNVIEQLNKIWTYEKSKNMRRSASELVAFRGNLFSLPNDCYWHVLFGLLFILWFYSFESYAMCTIFHNKWIQAKVCIRTSNSLTKISWSSCRELLSVQYIYIYTSLLTYHSDNSKVWMFHLNWAYICNLVCHAIAIVCRFGVAQRAAGPTTVTFFRLQRNKVNI